jgi:hypothetical protein
MTILNTYWRTERHVNAIKEKMHWLKPSDYIIIVTPDYNLKSLRSLGFVIHKIEIDYPYNQYGYYKSSNEIPQFFRTITVHSSDDLNYLKLSHPNAIYDCIKVADIRNFI